MEGLALLLQLVSWVLGIGSLICFIVTLIKMFQNDETTMGIVCIVTFFLCGIGALIAFIVGWINATKWQNQQVMIAWTFCIIGNLILVVLGIAFGVAMFNIQGAGVQPM